jgi:TolB protein
LKTRQFVFTFATIFLMVIAFSLQTRSSEADGPPTAITQLTNDHAIAVRPAWSPDNRFIAYQSNRNSDNYHIYVMDADGKNPRALTKGTGDDRHPLWTPDGKSILYDSFDGKTRDIWMVNVSDGSLKQLTHLAGLSNFPSVSPDQQRIAFYLYQDYELNIWTGKIDGTDLKPLTKGLASAKNNQCTFACHYVGWSPDGRTLAYSAGELDAIFTIPSDGGTPKTVVDDGQDNHFPWFLPDGRLAYITEHVQPGNKAWTDAWVYDLKTGEKGLMQEQMAMQGPFEWSNDITRVLFHSPRNGNFNIFVIDLNAPGGLDALQGKTIAPAAVPSPAFTAPVNAEAKPQDSTLPYLIIVAVLALAVSIVAFFYFQQKFRKS